MTKKMYVTVSLMLFSLFFGAGNLIFPPMVGKMSGTSAGITMIFFGLTAVVLPVMGVLAVSETKGLQNLANRVNPIFSMLFTVLIYLSIGPMLGIPRAGSLPFEMAVSPYLPESVNTKVALFIYTFVFFGCAYLLSLNPGKLVDRMGKFLTPTLLVMIVLLFASSFFKEMPAYSAPVQVYKSAPAIQGFLDGYNTLDAVAALNFGFVIYITLKGMKIEDDREIAKASRFCGIAAGTLLMTIYLILAHLGAESASMFPNTENGAEVLANISGYLLGGRGALLIAAIFTLACLTTSVGLITSCSAYFTELFNNRFSYKSWLTLWTISSMALANFGLNRILGYSVLILNIIYPVSIVLIIMATIHKQLKLENIIYKWTIGVTAVCSVLDVLSGKFAWAEVVVDLLPFSEYHLGWVVPAVSVFVLSLMVQKTIVCRVRTEEKF